jgi:integrase
VARKELEVSVYKYGKEKKFYKAELWIDNRRVKTKSGFTRKSDAKAWCETEKQKYSQEPNRSRSEDYTFCDLLEKYRTTHLVTLKPRTRHRYILDIDTRIMPFFKHFRLSRLRAIDFEDFRRGLLSHKSNLSPKSINNCTELVKSIVNKAVEWGWLEVSPFKLKSLRVHDKPYEWWDEKQYIQLFINGARNSPYLAAYLLALECGMRLGEIVGLSKQDVSLDLGQIHIHRQWLEHIGSYGPTKNSRERFIRYPTTGLLASALREAISRSNDPEIIFLTATGKRVLSRNLSGGRFQNLIMKLKLPRISFHGLRHTFASWYMIEQTDIWSLMQILGHSDIKTTQRYAHLSSKHVRTPNFNWQEKIPSISTLKREAG